PAVVILTGMYTVAIYFASGAAFFSGAGLLIAGLLIGAAGCGRVLRASGRLAIVLGVIVVALSATPIPIWAYGVWCASCAAWAVSRFDRAEMGRNRSGVEGVTGVRRLVELETTDSSKTGAGPCSRWGTIGRRAAAIVFVSCPLYAVAWELAFQLPP